MNPPIELIEAIPAGSATNHEGANAKNGAALQHEIQRLSSELERRNRELRMMLHERERMQAILISTLQSLTIGVMAVGQDGIVIVANPAACQILGQPLEEVAARHIDEILPAIQGRDELLLTLQGVGGALWRACWQGSAVDITRGRASQSFHIELTAVRALSPYDEQIAGLILLEDKTELRQLELQAALKSRLTGMGEIAMNLAHEIRNPLGSIALFATALERELTADESLAPLATQIVAGVNSLEHLVANTLEFSKPRRMTMSRVSLREVLSDTLVYVEHPVAQKGIRVEFEHDLQPEGWIAGDAEQLRQVFLNLMINAIQAMEEQGELRIGIAAATDGGWRVTIADDGVGIPEEQLERIFDPFFTTKDKGSGIGLAVVHTILSAHGARIEVSSRVAAGTTFRMTFPPNIEY